MLVCPRCRTNNHGTAAFCESCGKSLESLREADDAIEQMLLKEARKGAWALGIVAVLQAVGALIMDPGNWVLWGLVLVFAALAAWATRQPLVASAVGLGVFVLLHVTEAVVEPASIYKGIIMKVVVVVLLVGAIKSALRHRAFRLERAGA